MEESYAKFLTEYKEAKKNLKDRKDKMDDSIKEYMESKGLKELLIPGNKKIYYQDLKKIKLSSSK